MAQFVEPSYLGSGDSNLELLHGLSGDLDDQDAQNVTDLNTLLPEVHNLTTRGFLKFLARIVSNLDSDTLDGRIGLIIGETTDVASSDAAPHTFNDDFSALTAGSSIYARINALVSMIATFTNPRVIMPGGRGPPGPLFTYQAQAANYQIGSARDPPVQMPQNFELIFDDTENQFVVRRRGSSL